VRGARRRQGGRLPVPPRGPTRGAWRPRHPLEERTPEDSARPLSSRLLARRIDESQESLGR
jgi:hypothetical protein